MTISARTIIAMLAVVALGVTDARALAGTTGGINGIVSDADTKTPLAGATVTVESPSQKASVATGAGGTYSFVNLAPDTYTVRAEKDGYQAYAATDVSVSADQQLTVDLAETKAKAQ